MWWAFAILTTIGYGDVVPLTVGGKVFGVSIMILGVGVYSLPIGIIAPGFAN
jgi:voltage-gated potassium channel